jgi:hypothetical protein
MKKRNEFEKWNEGIYIIWFEMRKSGNSILNFEIQIEVKSLVTSFKLLVETKPGHVLLI